MTYRGTELADLTVRRCLFELVGGWRDGLSVRGDDTVIPGASGRIEEARREDLRAIRLHGIVLATSEANWNTVLGELETAFDVSAAAASLIVTAPFMGLATGTRTISARVESVVTRDLLYGLVTEYDVLLHSVASPPDWT